MLNKKRRYTDYSTYIKNKFGFRVQKISINAGFTCPNIDGSKGKGGCTYCNNNTFNPDYCKPIKPIKKQIEEGIAFFSKMYKSQKYLAYFQAFTNTYAPLNELKQKYEQALKHKDVIGLVIATRPDCITTEILNYLEQLVKDGYFIKLEFGLESTNNKTLDLINRCQSHEDAIKAFDMAKNREILLGAHIILGLPGESKKDMLSNAIAMNQLPIDTLKIHHLQIVKHTMMAFEYKTDASGFHFFTLEQYLDLIIEFLEILNPKIIVERFFSESPEHLLIAPKYGLKNFELVHKIEKRLKEKDSWQGRLFKKIM
ncbi:MAG: TIGR01212 family radical SAM protein [Flavobacteriales bacterium]|nr:TIGR01212 family radical SAM protein [Flavobacteriales bacterium]